MGLQTVSQCCGGLAELCASCSVRKGIAGGKLQLDTDMTKQLLSSKSVMRKLMAADLPVHLHFGWHMTCEEIHRIARLPLKVCSVPAPMACTPDMPARRGSAPVRCR